MADTELQQLIIYVGTTAQIEAAIQAGTITENDLAISTDAPDFQEKLTDVQINAVNSGITTQLVSLYSGHVADTTIHITAQEKTTWNNKQDAINDLDTIRSGASAGATALQPSALNGYATETWVGQQGFITSSAISDMQTKTNLVTSISASSTDIQYPSAKCVYNIVGNIETLLHNINSGS